jgi:cell division protein ZapA (FtsZ GTPase activity inhibitor)
VGWQGPSGAGNAQSSQTSTTETSGGSVSIQIGGVKLSVKSDKDPQVVEDIAAYVDDKVGGIREMAPSVATDKLLMLASMTVAEELFEARERVERLESALKERLDKCMAVLDDAEADRGR